jgi:adenylate cyclase
MADHEPREHSAQPRFLFGVTFTVTSCILVIVALGMAAVTWQQWSAAKEQTDDLQRRNAMLVMNQVEAHIDLFLRPAESYVQEMSVLPLMGDTNDPALLATSLAAASQIVEAGFLSVEGQDSIVERLDGALSFQTIDRRGDPIFEQQRQLRAMASEPTWGAPVYDSNIKAPVVTVWHAVRRDGRFIGAWHAAISIASLSEVVSEIGDQFEGTAFVMFGKDSVLAHPNLASQHPDVVPGKPSVDVSRVGDIILGSVWNAAAPSSKPVTIKRSCLLRTPTKVARRIPASCVACTTTAANRGR